MTIFERIRYLRRQRGMSQEELAKLVGYEGRSAISKVESGERDISQSMIAKYASALGVSPTYLLFGEEADSPAPDGDMIELSKTDTIGERIKQLRLEKEISQEELAKLLGYSHKSSVNKIELNINGIPSSKIVMLSRIFGVSISYLICGNPVDLAEKTSITHCDAMPEVYCQYLKLDEIDRAKVEAYITGLLSSDKYRAKNI